MRTFRAPNPHFVRRPNTITKHGRPLRYALSRRRRLLLEGTDEYFSSVWFLGHFDGNSGDTTFTDSSDTPLTISRSGNAQLSSAKAKWGSTSLLLDGSGDDVNVPSATFDIAASESFTIEAWINLDQLPSTRADNATIVGHYLNTGDQRGFIFDITQADLLRFYFSQNGITQKFAYTVPAGNEVTAGTWHHVAVCRDTDTIRLFLDGTQAGTDQADGTDIFNSSDPVRIGGVNVGGAVVNELDGYIDDVRITLGVARYTEDFTVPDRAFPDEA